MVKKNNSSNSLVFGQWPQAKMTFCTNLSQFSFWGFGGGAVTFWNWQDLAFKGRKQVTGTNGSTGKGCKKNFCSQNRKSS